MTRLQSDVPHDDPHLDDEEIFNMMRKNLSKRHVKVPAIVSNERKLQLLEDFKKNPLNASGQLVFAIANFRKMPLDILEMHCENNFLCIKKLLPNNTPLFHYYLLNTTPLDRLVYRLYVDDS